MGFHCFQSVVQTHLWERAARNVTIKMHRGYWGSIRSPVKEQQALEVRTAQQCAKIKQIKNRKKEIGLGGLGRQQGEPEPAIHSCNKGRVHPSWAALARAQPAGPEKLSLPFVQNSWALQNKTALTYWSKSSGGCRWLEHRQSSYRPHCVFQFPKGKVQRRQSEPIFGRAQRYDKN